ncbi:hypothetical protein BGZ94_000884 [Podila epigama]|nr:hypothetical protein BGZ94_000884 [Podila epigama]
MKASNLFVAVVLMFSAAAVSAVPTDASADAAQDLSGRRTCCKYAGSGQWCGPQGCCLWRECISYGGPAQCGYAGCCKKYNC